MQSKVEVTLVDGKLHVHVEAQPELPQQFDLWSRFHPMTNGNLVLDMTLDEIKLPSSEDLDAVSADEQARLDTDGGAPKD